MLLFNAEQMRAADRRAAEEFFIPGPVLMENAARGAAAVARKLLNAKGIDELHGIKVLALCGTGNNGGDASACARILANQGACARVVLLGSAQKLKGDALLNWRIAKACGLNMEEMDGNLDSLRARLAQSHLIVDGLLGTGFNGRLKDEFAGVIKVINEFSNKIPILAMDVPSGQNADNGSHGIVVLACATATFGGLKIGMALNPFPAGEIHVVDIGLPPAALDHVPGHVRLLEADMVADFLPRRGPLAHKGSFGHAFLLGGSPGKSGAMVLAARGAQASGAGLVTVSLPHSLLPALDSRLIAPMSLGLAETSQQGLSMKALEVLQVQPATSWVVGPGLGEEEESRSLARAFLQQTNLPIVVDADALNALAPLASKQPLSPNALFTPHPGEAARLLNCPVAEIQRDRLQAAREIALRTGAVCLLKGAASVLAAPDGRALINHTGNNLLAAGGSGDVLAGLAGGLMAQGLSAWQAGALAVYVHGLAADLAQEEGIKRGWPMERLADYVVKAWSVLEHDTL